MYCRYADSGQFSTSSRTKRSQLVGRLPSLVHSRLSFASCERLARHLQKHRMLFCGISTDNGHDNEDEATNIAEGRAHDLPTFFANSPLPSTLFPFTVRADIVVPENSNTWCFATNYANRHIPTKFHSVLSLPDASQLPSVVRRKAFVTTLMPLGYDDNPANCHLTLFHLQRLTTLSTTAFNYLRIAADYDKEVLALRQHLNAVATTYLPGIVCSDYDDQAHLGRILTHLSRFAALHLRLDAPRTFIARDCPIFYGMLFRQLSTISTETFLQSPHSPYLETFSSKSGVRAKLLAVPRPSLPYVLHVKVINSANAVATFQQELENSRSLITLMHHHMRTKGLRTDPDWLVFAKRAVAELAPVFPSDAKVHLCTPIPLSDHLFDILKAPRLSSVTVQTCSHRDD